MKEFEIQNIVRAIVFLSLFVMALAVMNPITKQKQESVNITGDLVVQINWPSEIPSDIDLWIQTPGDTPVGFSRKVGKSITLMKDDLGIIPNDLSGMNYELAISQLVLEGDYHINVVLYNLHNFTGSIPVDVIVTYRRGSSIILNKKVTLTLSVEKSILTALNFSLDEDLGLVRDSVNEEQYEMEFE